LVGSEDLLLCRQHIARHSRSFYLSSLLLPRPIRHQAWALYAFCRQADDAVDGDNPGDGTVPVDAPSEAAQLVAVAGLRQRLAAVYRGEPGEGQGHAIDRAFAQVVTRTRMPVQLPSRLLDGMEQDARGQHYHSWEDLYGYCFNVAATVGLMMTCVMGHKLPASRQAEVLLRAADLGVAMQLTNIARDVGEDARRGRVYLPDELLGQHGLSSAAVLAEADFPAATERGAAGGGGGLACAGRCALCGGRAGDCDASRWGAVGDSIGKPDLSADRAGAASAGAGLAAAAGAGQWASQAGVGGGGVSGGASAGGAALVADEDAGSGGRADWALLPGSRAAGLNG
jgi:phytoene/squalene synthetase